MVPFFSFSFLQVFKGMMAAIGDGNFMFAFNSAVFSDRILKIEVFSEESVPTSDGELTQPKKKEEEEEDANIERDDVPLERNKTSCRADCPNLRVESVHVSSIILAAKSQFFFKLFSNGMRESNQKDATLQINASEEAAFMELLRFLYGQKLSSTTHSFVLDLVMIADQFEVPSCMDYYIQLAVSLPMTQESALIYLNLPSSLSIASNIQPLTKIAKEFITNKYKEIIKFQDEVLTLPLTAIEVIFHSNDLEVQSEDLIFDLLVKWSRTHYPTLEAQREIFGSKFAALVRFPQISCTRLRELLASEDLHGDIISKFVNLALLFKSQAPHSLRALVPEQWFIERAYLHRPVMVMELETPYRHCIVFLDIKREKLATIFPKGKIYSQKLDLGGQDFILWGECSSSAGLYSGFENFGLYLAIQERKTADSTVEVEFSASKKSSRAFESKYRNSCHLNGSIQLGSRDLFGISWTSLMAANSDYFINEVLYLRVEVTLR